MTREMKVTFKQVARNFVDTHCQTRDDNSSWQSQGVIPQLGTMEEIRNQWIANQQKWGWTMYDIEEENTITFWKEM